ncbi:F-box family protein [Trifolium pratense]|uniref:F-box family protein n=1 Tax=Trifolium pratense TaxID=57577 RepID=A0A2K3NX29_TRIPR|nr:F-box family protein [Trifolium pratense]PNY07601.1 F-box family protein [Trifolium pratense]
MLDKHEMSSMSDFLEESSVREKMKRKRKNEDENDESEGNEDRLSDLPDGVLLHILSFLNTKHVVRTCVLSKRWKHLWKRIPTLILHSSRFSTVKQFSIFVSNILTRLDNSTALHALDLNRLGNIEPQILKKILNYVSSHNTHIQELGISVSADSSLIMSCVSSCHALTSLKLSIYPRDRYDFDSGILFPKSLNLPALTSLNLSNFVFCGDENGRAEPFLAFTKLNSLVIGSSMHNSSRPAFAKIELSSPCLRTFTFNGRPVHKICGSGLSSVKQVNITAQMYSVNDMSHMVLFSWLLELANVQSLTVSSTTLRILSLVPDLLDIELPSLCNLKSMKIKLEPSEVQLGLPLILEQDMLKKAAAKSRKEVAKLRKAFKTGWQLPSIPEGIVNFLLQNSPSAKVDITTY